MTETTTLLISQIRTDAFGTRAEREIRMLEDPPEGFVSFLRTMRLPEAGIPPLKPLEIYNKYTWLGFEPEFKNAIINAIPIQTGNIPSVDFDEKLGWVFHTLFTPGGTYSQKEIAYRFEHFRKLAAKAGYVSELEIEVALAGRLKKDGKNPRRQVRCWAGIADIVTDECIYELKDSLFSRESFFRAVGQVLLYRQAINPRLRPVIVGPHPNQDLIEAANRLGIEVLPWKNA